MIWASREVPRVAVTRAWVSPRVKSAEPWVRGRMPTSMVIGRISSRARSSKRLRLLSIGLRRIASSRTVKAFLACSRCSALLVVVAEGLLEVAVAHRLDGVAALELALGVERFGELLLEVRLTSWS